MSKGLKEEMGQDFKVTVHGDREQEFRDVFGTNTVCVESFIPQWGRLGDLPETEKIYLLDMEMLTGEQLERLEQHVARKFGAPVEEVRVELKAHGLPIRAKDCVVTIEHPHQWLGIDVVEAREMAEIAEDFECYSPDDDDLMF